MNNNTLSNVLKYLIFAGIFIIPFIFLFAPSDPSVQNPDSLIFFSNSFFFPFITSKAFVFRVIVEIILAAWLLLMLRDRRYVPKFSWITVAITSFAVITLLADIFGLYPLRSFWSNFERMEGWVAIVHIWAYFMVISTVLQDRKIWYKFFNISIFVAFLISIYGVAQLTGEATIHQGSSRIDASLGNAIYLAVYMLFHIFLSAYFFLLSWKKKEPVKIWLYGLLTLLFGYMLFETGTRGTLIGLVGGIMVMLAIITIFNKQHKKSRIISGSIIAFIIVLTVLFYLNKDAKFIQNNETLRRLASISWQDTKTQARGFIWPMAVKEIFDSPKEAIIGIGQENFNYIFNANYNPKMWNQEQWFDRAHSVFLDWLVASGLLGLLAYLSLFIFALISIWKSELSIAEKSILIGLFVGYGIHNIFVFDNLASYVLFSSMLGFVHILNSGKPLSWIEKRIHTQNENYNIVRDYAVMPVLIIVFLIVIYLVNIKPIRANGALVDSLQACSNRQASTALFERALKIGNTMADQEIREQLISCANSVINGQYPDKTKTEFVNLVSKEIENQIAITPNDARIYVLAGGFFSSFGQFNTSAPLLEKAAEISPNKQSILLQLASVYINQNRLDDALKLYKRAYEGEPSYELARNAYLSALIVAGKDEEAQKIFNDPAIWETVQVAQIYASAKNYPKSIALYKKLLQKEPKDISLKVQLATVQARAGQKYEAVSTLRSVIVDYPEYKSQVEEAIKQVESGKI